MDYCSPKVICPYYFGSDKITISCEGMSKREQNIRKFASKSYKKRHFEQYCCSYDYKECFLAKIIEKKYV